MSSRASDLREKKQGGRSLPRKSCKVPEWIRIYSGKMPAKIRTLPAKGRLKIKYKIKYKYKININTKGKATAAGLMVLMVMVRVSI
jgi:hypothetical protein